MDKLLQIIDPVMPFLPIFAWLSVATFLLSLVTIPVCLARIPANYFRYPLADSSRSNKISRFHYSLLWILRNCLAVLLLLAGLAMIVLPGQGFLTILMSLFVADFPGKRELERRVVAKPAVYKAINWIRAKKGVQQLDHPEL